MRTITKCRSCASEKLIEVVSLGDQYLSDFTDISNTTRPEKYPLTVVFCEECFLVQLRDSAPQSSLYTENYGYKSGINGTIRNDLAEIASRAMTQLSTNKDIITVLDIGANDGTLLSNYPKEFWRVACEPIKKFAKEAEEYSDVVIDDFFSKEAFEGKVSKNFDIITIISCFYDLDDPNKFVGDVAEMLAEDGAIIVQQNYVGGMLMQNAFDNIVHEHLEFYSLYSLEKLLARHGLEVYKIELNDINGGSFRTYIQKAGGFREIDKSVLGLRETEKLFKLDTPEPYVEFGKRVEQIGKEIHDFVEEQVNSGKKVYLYGASTRVNTLLQYAGLDNKFITTAIERNPEKWGKQIASLQIPIISEENGRKEKPDFFFIGPWFFKTELVNREKEYLESGGSMIFPLPALEVV